MIPYQNCEIYTSVTFYFLCKIVCGACEFYRVTMCSRRTPALTSIPERSEDEGGEVAGSGGERCERGRWVSKKKHDVLKAKYKCLKKLFQIYDASVIGYLPEQYAGACGDSYFLDEKPGPRKKRSRRRRSHASAGTDEDGSRSEAVVNEAETRSLVEIRSKHAATQATDENLVECEFTQTIPLPEIPISVPYLTLDDRRPSRFQRFLQRILGLKIDSPPVNMCSDHKVCYGEKRRRRGLRLRRLRRQKLSQSSVQSPAVLSVQAVERRYLLDTTPQQCPVLGCNMVLFGIIKYNDHLNLCHFRERKYVCHYCHFGFEHEYDKIGHEYEHIGINKVCSTMRSVPSTERNSVTVSVTQTEPESNRDLIPEEKLKKIISFFDKIDSEQVLSELKKNRFSESNLQCKTEDTNSTSDSEKSSKHTVSCVNLTKTRNTSRPTSCLTEHTSKGSIVTVKCPHCDDEFKSRRQLSVHVELEHRAHDKYSKYPRSEASSGEQVESSPGRVCVSGCSDCTNIVYTSTESIRKPSFLNNLIQNVKSRVSYKWEPTGSTMG